jgi:hypothetical protein
MRVFVRLGGIIMLLGGLWVLDLGSCDFFRGGRLGS